MACSTPPPANRRARRQGSRRPRTFPNPTIRVRYSNLQRGQRHIATCSDACTREGCRCVCHQGYWNAYTRDCAGLPYVEDLS